MGAHGDVSVRVCAFRGVATLPLHVAVESGRMRARGLEVDLTWTGSSDELMLGLIDGAYDVVQAAPDNVIAWRDRTEAPIRAWYGGSSGPISLILGPGVESIEGLRGGPVAVDYPNTGWAPIMLRILADHGVAAHEIEQVPMGATPKVFAAVIEGRSPAGMVNEPWATRAAGRGCRIAADHRSVAPRLATSAGAALEPWLARHPSVAEAFLRAIVGATTWILDPASRGAVIVALGDHLAAAPGETAALYDRSVDPSSGWPPSAFLDLGGIEALLELRTAVGDQVRGSAGDYATLDVVRRVFDPPLLDRTPRRCNNGRPDV